MRVPAQAIRALCMLCSFDAQDRFRIRGHSLFRAKSKEIPMRLESIKLAGFRGISKLKLEFPEQVNVLVGVNGSGKSAVLDCTAIMLSRLIGRIRSSAGTGRYFVDSDISNKTSETQNKVVINFQGQSVHWSVTKSRKGRRRQTITRLDVMKKHIEQFRSELDEDEHANLPVVVYYPVNRAVLDIPLRIRTRHQFDDRLAAYDQALSGEGRSFRVFFEWFREREDLENERRIDRSGFRDPQLRAVRTAISGLLPGFRKLKIRRSPLRMIVEKNGEELIVNQLSDGEKCTLAMAGDLARRMAIANPAMEDPLETEAVVLIDEIDLHLHPGWHRHIVSALAETFTSTQFLLSTHSPAILSQLKSDSIWIMKKTKSGIVANRPEDAYGQTVNRILEDIMGASARPREIEEKLDKLYFLIKKNNMEKAKYLLRNLQDTIGMDPDLVKASVLIDRQEISRK